MSEEKTVKSGPWSPKIGLLVPSSNTTMEPEFSQYLPRGASLHSARMRIVETTDEGLRQMDEDLDRAMELLGTAAVDVVCYGCTSGSFREGKEHAGRLRHRIEGVVGVPCAVTSEAVVDALRHKGVGRLVVATPYIDDLNEKEAQFLAGHGFEVLEIRGLGIVNNLDIGRCSPEQAYRLGVELMRDHPSAEGLFISCTNFPTFEIIRRLSDEISRPVITSNQASLWATCRQVGLAGSFPGLGS